MACITFLGIRWPVESWRMFSVSVADVQRFRDAMTAANLAPKTINRRISSLSSFYKYLGSGEWRWRPRMRGQNRRPSMAKAAKLISVYPCVSV